MKGTIPDPIARSNQLRKKVNRIEKGLDRMGRESLHLRGEYARLLSRCIRVIARQDAAEADQLDKDLDLLLKKIGDAPTQTG